MSIRSLCSRHTIDVYSLTQGKDSSGGNTVSTSAVYSSMPCNVQPATSEVITEYKQRDEKVTYSVFWADFTKTINIGHRVVYGGKNFLVVGLKEDTQKQKWKRADLKIEHS